MNEAPGRGQGVAARDERRAATAERDVPGPAASRPAVAGVSPVVLAWITPGLGWRCERCGIVLGLAGSGLCSGCRG